MVVCVDLGIFLGDVLKCLPALLSAPACHSLEGLTKGRKGRRDHCGLWADWSTHDVGLP